MRWLLDTCTISEVVYPKPHPGVLRWLDLHSHDCAIASISFGEIQYGITCLPLGKRRNHLQVWLASLHQKFAGRILPTDEAVWCQFGELKASLRAIGRMQDNIDLAIAATAMQHGLAVVTRNTKHFQDTGLTLVNPWEENRPH